MGAVILIVATAVAAILASRHEEDIAPRGRVAWMRTIAYWLFTLLIAFEMAAGSLWDLMRIEYVRVILTHLGYPLYLLYIIGAWIVSVRPGAARAALPKVEGMGICRSVFQLHRSSGFSPAGWRRRGPMGRATDFLHICSGVVGAAPCAPAYSAARSSRQNTRGYMVRSGSHCRGDAGLCILYTPERRPAAVKGLQTADAASAGTHFLPVTSSPFGPSSVCARNFFFRRYTYAIAHQKSSNAHS